MKVIFIFHIHFRAAAVIGWFMLWLVHALVELVGRLVGQVDRTGQIQKMAVMWNFCLPEIKRDLLYASKECSERGLVNSAKW